MYPHIVAVIGTIEPINPRNNPSITKGNLITKLLVPTNLIISISFLLAKIVNFIGNFDDSYLSETNYKPI